jgi:hypothetical protein
VVAASLPVAMSRARNASHVYTTAPDLHQAAQRLLVLG